MTGMLLDTGGLTVLAAGAVWCVSSLAGAQVPADVACTVAEVTGTIFSLIVLSFFHAGLQACRHGLRVSHNRCEELLPPTQ